MRRDYINTFLKKTSVMALALAGFAGVAQEEKKKLDFSGSVDAYFRTNLTSKNRPGVAPATSFANGSGFSLGMANLIGSYEGDRAGFVADLVFGPRGTEAVFNSTGSAAIVNQLYGYWNASETVTLTIGNFNTFLGYEVISPTGNFNYSTSYMFSYGPFSHTGLKADFAIDDNWSAMLAIMNPTDFTENNPYDTYILGAQLGYANDNGSAYLNFRYGNEGEPGMVGPTLQIDLTTGWDIDEQFYLGFNGTILNTAAQDSDTGDSEGFYGVALYPQYSFSEEFALGIRGEYFAQTSDADDYDSPSVIAATLTGQYKVGDLTIIPEFRLDATDEENAIFNSAFTDSDGVVSGSLVSFVLGAVYAF